MAPPQVQWRALPPALPRCRTALPRRQQSHALLQQWPRLRTTRTAETLMRIRQLPDCPIVYHAARCQLPLRHRAPLRAARVPPLALPRGPALPPRQPPSQPRRRPARHTAALPLHPAPAHPPPPPPLMRPQLVPPRHQSLLAAPRPLLGVQASPAPNPGLPRPPLPGSGLEPATAAPGAA